MSRANFADIPVYDFSGGQASVKASNTLNLNEFKKLENIIILPAAAGFRPKPGNTKHNSVVLNNGLPLQGIGYGNVSGSKEIYVISATKAFMDEGLTGTFTEITGTASISQSQDNLWDFLKFNNAIIGVGGNGIDVPISRVDNGNFAPLGGSPPTAVGGFVHNNRVFLFAGSTLSWSVLGTHDDYTGDGSGSQDVEADNGEDIVIGLPININTALIFKNSSAHVMSGRTDPFSVFPLSGFPGCVGKKAGIVINGLAYWISPQAKLIISDGKDIIDVKAIPKLHNVDDVLGEVTSARLPQTQLTRKRGKDYDWLIISISRDSGKNNYAIIWDLINRCYITAPTGLNGNGFVAAFDNSDLFIAGHDGFVYKAMVEETTTDASEEGNNVVWSIESDEINLRKNIAIIKIEKVSISFKTATTGSITFKWGYDRSGLPNSTGFSIIPFGDVYGTGLYGTARYTSLKTTNKNINTLGRGNTFKYGLTGSGVTNTVISGFNFIGKQKGEKEYNAR